ncbi:hypothetical protein D9M71_538570 [compost metagenome]
MVNRGVDAQLSVECFPLHAYFVGLALLRVEACAETTRATVRLVGTRRIDVDGQAVGQVVYQPGPRHYGFVGLLPAATSRQIVAIVMLETFDPHAGEKLESLGEGDLVLHEQSPCLQLFVVVGGSAGQRRARLARYRFEDVDRIGVEGSTGSPNERFVMEVFVLHSGE